MKPEHTPRGWEGQTPEYRKLRDELLEAETARKDQRERVAALRRTLPFGPVIAEDYLFHEGPAELTKDADDSNDEIREVRMSELFAPGKDSLIVIHTMFPEDDERPCPMCNMWADGYNATAPHVADNVNFVLVAKKEIRELRRWARGRSWNRIRLLSSHGSRFNLDFGAEGKDGRQFPGVSVFRRESDRIHHFSSTEAGFTPNAIDPNVKEYRGIDLFSPVWHLFDLLPEGREEWLPSYSYE